MRLPPINSPNARHFRGEPRYFLYKKQTQSSLGATQTNSQAKTRGRTPSSPYPVICQVGLCSITFPWGLQKLCKSSLMTVILLSTNESELQHTAPHYQRWRWWRMGRNTHQDAELSKTALFSRWDRLWAQRGLAQCRLSRQRSASCAHPCHSADQTLTKTVPTDFYNHRSHPHITLLAEWQQMNE